MVASLVVTSEKRRLSVDAKIEASTLLAGVVLPARLVSIEYWRLRCSEDVTTLCFFLM